MSDPVTGLTVGGMVLSAVGTVASVQSQMQQGKEQNKWNQYNAAVAERDAEAARQSAEYEAALKRREGEKLLSRQRALYGKAGVTFKGSPLMLMEETAADIEMDALMIERTGKLTASRYGEEATLSRMKGTSAQKAGYYGAGTTLLTGAGQAINTYGNYLSTQ
ncbi:hypothetical protein K9N50_10735 [bacterium]|nr:hypothetical protein [bacterium]